MDYGMLIVISILMLYLAMSFRIAKDNERFAVWTLGRFAGFKGPGLVLKMPGGNAQFARITLGAEGLIQSNELALFGDHAIPYQAATSVRAGGKVRITGFEKSAVRVEVLQQVVVCEKCGHKNTL